MLICVRPHCGGCVVREWDYFLGWHLKCLSCGRTDEEVADLVWKGGKPARGYSINPENHRRHIYYERYKRDIILDYLSGGRRFVMSKWGVPQGTWWKLCDKWGLPNENQRKRGVLVT